MNQTRRTEVRGQIIATLKQGLFGPLMTEDNPDVDWVKKVINQLELGIYRTADSQDRTNDIQLLSYYNNYAQKVVTNLGPYLQEKLLSEEIDPFLVAEMATIDLNPEPTKGHRAFIDKQKNVKEEHAFSSLYSCPKCPANCKWNVIEEQHQNRSADEAKTINLTCINCGFQFTPST